MWRISKYLPGLHSVYTSTVGFCSRHPIATRIAVASVAGIVGFKVVKYLKNKTPKNLILELDLTDNDLSETRTDPFLHTVQPGMSLRDVIESISIASKDPDVKGLIVKITQRVNFGFACIQELRNAILQFREKGKIAVFFADTIGEIENALFLYYLASAFSLIYVCPTGDVSLLLTVTNVAFLRQMFDKLGVIPQLSQRKEYKLGANAFTESKLTDEHREVIDSIFADLYAQIIAGIGRERQKSEEDIRNLLEKGPYTADDAKRAGLIDGALYYDEAYDKLLEKLGKFKDKANYLFLDKYLSKKGPKYEKKKSKHNVIALIVAEGVIHRGPSKSRYIGGPSIGAETVASAIRAAAKDKEVKVIVLRINSGGGSATASDDILHEIERAQVLGKKVVVSMGDCAASGGYWISLSADHIVAQPGTLTGSIGVVSGKFIFRGLFEKLGITFDEVHFNTAQKRDSFFSSLHEYNEETSQMMDKELDRYYDDFLRKVAEGRKISADEIEHIAKGRVWTGRQAKEVRLVDSLGGLDDAIQIAKIFANIPAEETPYICNYPKIQPLWKLYTGFTNRNDRDVYRRGFEVSAFESVLSTLRCVNIVSSVVQMFAHNLGVAYADFEVIRGYQPVINPAARSMAAGFGH